MMLLDLILVLLFFSFFNVCIDFNNIIRFLIGVVLMKVIDFDV